MNTPRWIHLFVLFVIVGFSNRAAVGASVSGGTPPGATSGPASADQGGAVQAAVATLISQAEEGQRLKEIRGALQANLDQARARLRAHEATRPADDASEATSKAWEKTRDDLRKPVETAAAAMARFDDVTLPAFKRRVEEAKQRLEAADRESAANAEQRRQSAEAVAAIGAALRAIQLIQNPPPPKPGKPSPTPAVPVVRP